MTAPQRRRGPATRGPSTSVNLTVRAAPEERARWQAAADRAGVSLGEWLRVAAEAATVDATTLAARVRELEVGITKTAYDIEHDARLMAAALRELARSDD